MAHQIRKSGLRVEQQKPINVYYDGVQVGCYVADLIVNDRVAVELKATTALTEQNVAQCLNFLKAAGLQLGLVLNFGTAKIGIKRIVNYLKFSSTIADNDD